MDATTRYARQIALAEIGEAGQAQLAAATVLIVGVGGLGCAAAQYLACGGIGRLILNDFDRVDSSNLPRQVLFTPEDVGKLKVDAAERRLHALNPEAAVETLPDRLDRAGVGDAVARADLVLDCSDNFATRLAVNRACVERGRPLVSGAAVRLEGQVGVFPNRSGGPCYRCVYDDEDSWLGDCQGNGVLAPVPGVIGAMMAVEAMLLAAGHASALAGRLLLWDARYGQWERTVIKPDPGCPVCGAGAAEA